MDILHELPAVKIWVNGAPQRVAKGNRGDVKIHLKEGWNRLLVKAICDQAQKPYACAGNFPKDELGKITWRFAAYIRPAGSRQNYSGGYETKNIAWMLKLPGAMRPSPLSPATSCSLAAVTAICFASINTAARFSGCTPEHVGTP